MKKLQLLSALIGLSLLVSVPGKASTITTLFAGDNWGAVGNAVYFDITVGANPITITGLETNTNSTGAFDLTIYLTGPSGTRVGNETNSAIWTMVATGSGVALGADNPSVVNLSNTFSLLANTTYGVALAMGSTAEHRYTNGTGSNQSYSNGDLSLSLGSSTIAAFFSPTYDPRVWNGSIQYTVDAPVPEPSTISLTLIGGAVLLLGARRRKDS